MAHEMDEESLLKAHANQKDITEAIVQLFRNVMRGVALQDAQSPAYQTRKQFAHICKLISYSEQFHEHQAFVDAFTRLKPWDRSEPRQKQLVEAALRGMRFLIESAADDNLARARASQREADFLTSIQRFCDPT